MSKSSQTDVSSSLSKSISMPLGPSKMTAPWAEGTLCALCRSLIRGNTSLLYPEKLMRIAAARKCALCRFLFEELVFRTFRAYGRRADLQISRTGSQISALDYNNTVHHFEIHTGDETSAELINKQYMSEGLPDLRNSADGPRSEASLGALAYGPSVYRKIQAHPNTAQCWSLIESWIHQCTSNHIACQNTKTPGLPSRLIDVLSLRVVSGGDCEPGAKYAALSHCWGSVPTALMTSSKLELYRRQIYIHDLSQNFQDAISATKRLKLHYLWIDALCIIQDSADDWITEAARMGNYYRDAYVVLSSLSSTDGRLGFLRARNEVSTVYLGGGLRLRHARPAWSEIFRDSALSTRAWALQERLLATRIVHFEQGELFWECQECAARESSFVQKTGPYEGTDWTDESFKRSLAFDSLLEGSFDSKALQESLMSQWYRVLTQYSALHVTYYADIFDAISGIAQKFSEATGFSYVAGIWQERVHEGLLWHAETEDSKTGHFWVAPSWSWASLGGPIRMLHGRRSTPANSEHDAEFTDVSVKLASSNPFARIEDASMHVAALHFEAHCMPSSTGDTEYGSPYLHMVLNIFNQFGAFVGTGYLDRFPSRAPSICTAIVISQRQDPEFGNMLVTYFILIETATRSDTEMSDSGASKPETPAGAYRRIGIGQTADSTYGYTTSTLDLGSCERAAFLLV